MWFSLIQLLVDANNGYAILNIEPSRIQHISPIHRNCELENKHPSRGYSFQSPLEGDKSKFIHTLFSTLLRGEKQEMHF
jgi:hypothetical protein